MSKIIVTFTFGWKVIYIQHGLNKVEWDGSALTDVQNVAFFKCKCHFIKCTLEK